MADMFEMVKKMGQKLIKVINIMLTVFSYCYPVYISSGSHTGYICPGDTQCSDNLINEEYELQQYSLL